VTIHPLDHIPELAGLATYADAARIGFSVDENVRRLVRYHWVARQLMATLIARIPAEPVWEVKCALALHQWQLAESVDALRARIAEMRSPMPPVDAPPDPAIDLFLAEARRSATTAEVLAGVYQTCFARLADAYEAHIARTNPLVDQPTVRVLRIALMDLRDAIEWSERAGAALGAFDPAAIDAAREWTSHLNAYVRNAGGIAGDELRSDPFTDDSSLPAPRSSRPATADFHPRRDERFAGSYNFEFPPHVVYNMPDVPPDERNLALLCKRTLEMDVPEMMASFITERANEPWEFYRDYSRQLWDEARHAMMGTVAFEARGIDWKREIPLNVSFALRLNLHASPLERQVMLFAIEQSLMPGDTGKRFEYETARAAGDDLSAHFHDYDWADEVLHAQIGRRMLRRDGISGDEAREQALSIHERTWAALDRYRDPGEQRNWWPDFVRRALGHESAVAEQPALGPSNVFNE
jgi:hypothetical protein